jgi:hypothetical protein
VCKNDLISTNDNEFEQFYWKSNPGHLSMSNLNGLAKLSPKLNSTEASHILTVGKRQPTDGLIAIGLPVCKLGYSESCLDTCGSTFVVQTHFIQCSLRMHEAFR